MEFEQPNNGCHAFVRPLLYLHVNQVRYLIICMYTCTVHLVLIISMYASRACTLLSRPVLIF